MGCPAFCTCPWGCGPSTFYGQRHSRCTGFWGCGPPTLYGRGHSSFWRYYGASDASIWGIIPIWVGGGSGFPSVAASGVLGGGLGFWGLPPFSLADGDPSARSHALASGHPSEHPFGNGVGTGALAAGSGPVDPRLPHDEAGWLGPSSGRGVAGLKVRGRVDKGKGRAVSSRARTPPPSPRCACSPLPLWERRLD